MEKMYHIGFDDSHGARYALLPGDPGRVERIASYLENSKAFCVNREYTAYLGQLGGENVLVVSTGMGGPSAAICIEELFKTGVDTFIRIGTCGGMAEKVCGGDIVIANAAVRMEGTSKEYVGVEYPAVSDFEVTAALLEAAKGSGKNYHLGVVQCKDSFYGQHDPERMPEGEELMRKWRAWIKAGCLASEMESAAIFIVAGILGARAGCVLNTVWNQERIGKGMADTECHDTEPAIKIAVRALEFLIRAKQTKQ